MQQTILTDRYGRQYVQHLTKRNAKGEIISMGGRFYLPVGPTNYTIKN